MVLNTEKILSAFVIVFLIGNRSGSKPDSEQLPDLAILDT
jgi:hypothetical protein